MNIRYTAKSKGQASWEDGVGPQDHVQHQRHVWIGARDSLFMGPSEDPDGWRPPVLSQFEMQHIRDNAREMVAGWNSFHNIRNT